MSSKGWLSKEGFEALDNLLSKLGYGGYYDFLECLRGIASNIGALTVEGGEIDRESLKTIPEVMDCLESWSDGVFIFRSSNEWQFDKDVLKILLDVEAATKKAKEQNK